MILVITKISILTKTWFSNGYFKWKRFSRWRCHESYDRSIKLISVKDPADLPWKDLEIDVVIESTGIFRDNDSLNKHLNAGAKKVLLTVPPKDEIDATIVLGVNDEDLSPEHKIVSNASCTTNCLAPIAKVLDDNFGIKSGLMTTVHAYQRPSISRNYSQRL